MKPALWMTACLILLTLAVYWPIQHAGFVSYDDGDYVFNNPHVQAGFGTAGMKYAFTTFQVGNWNPLLWISFFTDRAVLGLRPGAMHVENVLLHLLTGILLWRLLFVMTGEMNRSFIVAALFLVHPMHVESVAWISERKDVLSTPLLIGAMLAYQRYCTQTNVARRSIFYALLIVLFTLSLMTKSMGTTLPAVLLLLDFWPLRRCPARSRFWLVIEKLPLFAISIAIVVLAAHSQTVMGSTASLQELGILDRIDNAVVCYSIYIAKLAVPMNLAVFYQHPGSRPLAQAIAAGGLLIIVTLLFYRQRQKSPYLLIGWLWFLGTLVPVIGLVQIGGQAMADRYSYLPSIGLLIAAVWGISAALENTAAQAVLAITALGLFSILTRQQVLYWYDTQSLFTHAANVTDDNPVAHNELAHLAMNRHDYKTAVDEFNLALRHGDNARAYNGLGNCWIDTDLDKAIRYYRKALELDSHPPLFHVNLAAALRLKGELDEARQQVQMALQLDPSCAAAIKEQADIESARRSPLR